MTVGTHLFSFPYNRRDRHTKTPLKLYFANKQNIKNKQFKTMGGEKEKVPV